jgi:uncharacterized protein (DUF1501 family)
MRTTWNDAECSRRSVLKLGIAGAALLTCPGTLLRQKAFAQTANPHFMVMMFADGGWDPTQTLDVHDPLDMTDGVDVDVPFEISGLPPSQIATIGPITYMSNPTTRPAVDAFFGAWAGRTAIINGINTRSTAHDQSRQLVLTGYLDATRADFAVVAAHHNGADLPLPHLLLGGQSFGGAYAGLSGRLGGQMSQAIAYNRIRDNRLAVSAIGEAYIQQALEWERMIDEGAPADFVAGKAAQFHDANMRADKLARLATSLNINMGNGQQLAQSLANAFQSGLTTSVSLQPSGGFDTHNDNTQQNARWNQVFTFLKQFVDELAATPGVGGSGTLLDQTTIVYCSEFARTPMLNGDNGKDHHPYTSMLVVGKGVKPGVYGRTDDEQEGVKINLATGQPADNGQLLDVTNMVAGLVTLAGANSDEYLPTVTPFTGFIA